LLNQGVAGSESAPPGVLNRSEGVNAPPRRGSASARGSVVSISIKSPEEEGGDDERGQLEKGPSQTTAFSRTSVGAANLHWNDIDCRPSWRSMPCLKVHFQDALLERQFTKKSASKT